MLNSREKFKGSSKPKTHFAENTYVQFASLILVHLKAMNRRLKTLRRSTDNFRWVLIFIYSLFFRIFAAAEAPIDWEPVDVSPVKQVDFELSFVFLSLCQKYLVFTFYGQADGTMGIPKAAIDSVNKNGIGLKSPLMTPVGKGFRSLNLALRKEFSLYANVRPCKSLEGYKTLYDNVDVVTIR